MSFQIPGIGPKTEDKLKQLNISSDFDLLYHFPHRYIDFSKVIPISKIIVNENCTIRGKIFHIENIYTRSQKSLQKITLTDNSGQIELVWFNQPFLVKNFKVGDTWSFAGTPSLYKNKLTIFAQNTANITLGKLFQFIQKPRV